MKKFTETSSTFEVVLKQALAAYSDCHEEGIDQERDLNFKASHAVSGASFVDILKRCCPQGYNGMDAAAIENVRALFGDDAEYVVAREGSPCVYVKVNSRVWLDRAVVLQDLRADEVSFEGNNVFRIWWD